MCVCGEWGGGGGRIGGWGQSTGNFDFVRLYLGRDFEIHN